MPFIDYAVSYPWKPVAVTSLPCRGTPDLKTAVMPLRNEAPSSP